MLVPFARTLILYITVILAIRFMGKRQVGEMQPNELVITILISAVASVPMQDIDIPLLHGLAPILTLIAAEVAVSALSVHWPRLRRLLSGKPVPVVRRGKVDQAALQTLRLSLDDLFEDLRLSGVFDLRQVELAQVETNGKLSLLLSPADQPLTPRQAGLRLSEAEPFAVVVSDGELRRDAMTQMGLTDEWLMRALKEHGAEDVKQVFLLCADRKGQIIFQRKERISCDGERR